MTIFNFKISETTKFVKIKKWSNLFILGGTAVFVWQTQWYKLQLKIAFEDNSLNREAIENCPTLQKVISNTSNCIILFKGIYRPTFWLPTSFS